MRTKDLVYTLLTVTYLALTTHASNTALTIDENGTTEFSGQVKMNSKIQPALSVSGETQLLEDVHIGSQDKPKKLIVNDNPLDVATLLSCFSYDGQNLTINKSLTVNGNLTVQGDLTVKGTTWNNVVTVKDGSIIMEGKLYKIINKKTQKALNGCGYDIGKGSVSVEDNIEDKDSDHHLWHFIKINDFYKIKNKNSGHVLNSRGKEILEDGATMEEDTLTGYENYRLWSLVKFGNFYRITNKNSQNLLQSHENKTGKGSALMMSSYRIETGGFGDLSSGFGSLRDYEIYVDLSLWDIKMI